MRNRAYRAASVKQVQVAQVVRQLAPGQVWVGVDIGKKQALCVVRDGTGHFERPWRVQTPSEVGDLVERLKELAQHRALVVAMESTGTYGDALRQALGDAGLAVHRVSSKASSDYAEVFDGVPSAHDGKDAAVVAELAAIGKSSAWPLVPSTAREAELEAEVAWLDTQQSIAQNWCGQLESLLSRHWPEATRVLSLSSGTLLRALIEYGSPAALAADPQAGAKLKRWGRQFLKPEKVQALLESARRTIGVRMNDATADLVRRCARQAWSLQIEIRRSNRRLTTWAKEDPRLQIQAAIVGPATACVLQVTVGQPEEYHCGAAYRKAMGLNLKERSSGKHQGKLKITKRGPSLARRWLYFAALRTVQQPPVKSWFEAKKQKDQDRGNGAVVAVMRKLALALYAVSQGETFSLERLLPGHALRRPASSKRQRTEDSFSKGGLSHRPKAK